LALGQLGDFAVGWRHSHEQAFLEPCIFLAHGVGQDALERNLRRAAVVVRNPSRELEHLRRHETVRADDLRDGPQVRVRALLDDRGHDAVHLARAEGDFDARAHVNARCQLRRNGVIKLLAERDLEGDAGDHR
jgi:hypothetical protein